MFEKSRIARIERELAGLQAKLKATREALSWVADGSSMPGALVYDVRTLPQQIAELEEHKRQLAARIART